MQATHLPLPSSDAVLIGLAALVPTLIPVLRAFGGHFSTMSREGTHALLAFFLGFSVAEIVLDRHHGGTTKIAGEGLRLILVLILGFLGPSIFGLADARLISLGYPVTVIWLTAFLLVALMFLIARSFGYISVPVVIGVLMLILRYWHGRPVIFIAYGLAWLLLLSGVRFAVTDGLKAENAQRLSKATFVPRILWAALWLAGSLAALALGGKLLVYG